MDKNSNNDFKGEKINEPEGIKYKDFKKEANMDPEKRADAVGHDLKDDLHPDMGQGIKQ